MGFSEACRRPADTWEGWELVQARLQVHGCRSCGIHVHSVKCWQLGRQSVDGSERVGISSTALQSVIVGESPQNETCCGWLYEKQAMLTHVEMEHLQCKKSLNKFTKLQHAHQNTWGSACGKTLKQMHVCCLAIASAHRSPFPANDSHDS